MSADIDSRPIDGIGSLPIKKKTNDRPDAEEWLPIPEKPYLMRNIKTGQFKTIDFTPPYPSVPYI